jgi:osmotically-inducible protein OsmY
MRFRDKGLAFLAGFGLGALVMYFMDPGMGARRRAVARDKIQRYGRRTGEVVEEQAKDLAQRAKGAASQARRKIDEAITGDDVLVKRVRTALGRVISRPGDVTVSAEHGEVTLSGIILEEDASALGPVVSGVRGVKNVIDHTEVQEEAIG